MSHAHIYAYAHQLRLLGIPMNLGQERRGVDMGPSVVKINPILDDGNRTAQLACTWCHRCWARGPCNRCFGVSGASLC